MARDEPSKCPTRAAVYAAIDSHASNSGGRAQTHSRTLHHTYYHNTIVSTHHIHTRPQRAAPPTRSHSSYRSTLLLQPCCDHSSDDGGTPSSLSSHHTLDVLVSCCRGSTSEQVQSQQHTLSTLSTAQPTVSIIRTVRTIAPCRLQSEIEPLALTDCFYFVVVLCDLLPAVLHLSVSASTVHCPPFPLTLSLVIALQHFVDATLLTVHQAWLSPLEGVLYVVALMVCTCIATASRRVWRSTPAACVVTAPTIIVQMATAT